MVLAKSKNAVGLGNSLMNDRFGKKKGSDRKKASASGIQRINHATGETYVTNERQKASWVKMRSVTEQPALDEFLSTAELAGTDFTAEKINNVKIIRTSEKNPYLLSSIEEQEVVGKQAALRGCLTVPRRPSWKSTTTPEQLDSLERNSFLEWRRGLAEVQQDNDLLMTPFERNIEVWRQLWRVIERSNLVVQIVDARNPLLFRSEDLEKYVKDLDSGKQNLLLVNKADLLTLKQRQIWADYFEAAEIPFTFFSASLAKEFNEANLNDPEGANENDIKNTNEMFEYESTHIANVHELEALFLKHALLGADVELDKSTKIQIGLVGYPNVGKSSTINALMGAKKVSVSSTPGKTKHFQTINLSDKVLLCDCPGLVFPNFATTKAELVCNGILPIDQLREFTGPVGLITRRIPKSLLEGIYGIKIKMKPLEEGGIGIPTAEELLIAYAKSRGFTRSGQGQPDESRAARYILKDFVNGKLLFCHPPPSETNAIEFNAEHHNHETTLEQEIILASSEIAKLELTEKKSQPLQEQGLKSQKLDNSFFSTSQRNAAHLRMPFNYKYSEQGKADGVLLSQRNKSTSDQEKDLNPDGSIHVMTKKHFKSGKKGSNKRRLNFFED
ncbi:Large subunit GTPase 1 [Erysiphe neolycopersici]|uniref:Large subunit GTPase 1 n=1 Tax=Erysiphe neolycopersici TaxID=212602 RepID=A0A420HEZ7_9PEZI|nr:Large subunit GTPase 1 [Erysiphe neolycopersici]